MTTLLDKWQRYVDGGNPPSSLYSGIRELCDYAASEHERADGLLRELETLDGEWVEDYDKLKKELASEHERADGLAVALEQVDNELIAEISATKGARQVARLLLRMAKAAQRCGVSELASASYVSEIDAALAAMPAWLRRLVEQ